eukprot:jgi/Mesvir1/16649/Mv10188-RA.1
MGTSNQKILPMGTMQHYLSRKATLFMPIAGSGRRMGSQMARASLDPALSRCLLLEGEFTGQREDACRFLTRRGWHHSNSPWGALCGCWRPPPVRGTATTDQRASSACDGHPADGSAAEPTEPDADLLDHKWIFWDPGECSGECRPVGTAHAVADEADGGSPQMSGPIQGQLARGGGAWDHEEVGGGGGGARLSRQPPESRLPLSQGLSGLHSRSSQPSSKGAVHRPSSRRSSDGQLAACMQEPPTNAHTQGNASSFHNGVMDQYGGEVGGQGTPRVSASADTRTDADGSSHGGEGGDAISTLREPVGCIPRMGGWLDYYAWRGLASTCPAALMLHMPLTLFYFLQLSRSSIPGLASPGCHVDVLVLGPDEEYRNLAPFKELAALLPATHLHLHMIGPAVPAARDGERIILKAARRPSSPTLSEPRHAAHDRRRSLHGTNREHRDSGGEAHVDDMEAEEGTVERVESARQDHVDRPTPPLPPGRQAPTCREIPAGEPRGSLEVHLMRGLCHERVPDLHLPQGRAVDLVVGFNAGIAAYASWLPTLRFITSGGCGSTPPSFFTDYAEEAVLMALAAVTSDPLLLARYTITHQDGRL